jgi:hypothetical protein
MYFLHRRLLLLNAPQVLEPVKESLVQAYASEIQLAINQSQSKNVEDGVNNAISEMPGYKYPGVNLGKFVYPSVTKDNLDTFKQKAEEYKRYSGGYRSWMRYVEGPWGQTQLFRKQIYTRWAVILEEHGINPAEEGLTELVLDR